MWFSIFSLNYDEIASISHAFGKKEREEFHLKDLRDGKWTAWYNSGKKEREEFYKKGKKVGKWNYYNSEGWKESIISYKNDNKDEDLSRKLVKPKKNPPLKKLFTCVYCEKKFSHLASMKVHEKVHLGGKPHQCDMCEAKFSNKFDLSARFLKIVSQSLEKSFESQRNNMFF